jgi:(p)ppGpp synthase/HD superfamily hydrolase
MRLFEFSLFELNISQTLKFIQQAHGDQLYGKLPYWTHPRAVALTGKKIFGSKFNSDAVKVAFLHDVVEDTNIGLDELRKLDFSETVIQAVDLLTKDKSLTYSQNIEKIINSKNSLAMMVKYADNYENFTGDKSGWDPKKASSSQKKYLASLNMLGDKLGVNHHIEENFADGKKPGRKGLAKRSGVNTKASVSSLRKTAKNSSGEKQRMAHWLANMKAGRAKKNK